MDKTHILYLDARYRKLHKTIRVISASIFFVYLFQPLAAQCAL